MKNMPVPLKPKTLAWSIAVMLGGCALLSSPVIAAFEGMKPALLAVVFGPILMWAGFRWAGAGGRSRTRSRLGSGGGRSVSELG
ncbi:MAG: hypothetical protein H6729_11140 [Deltaproteobacteria bacterium]|nr:hypothetical protein [Deltaproteobacteria bacterium]